MIINQPLTNKVYLSGITVKTFMRVLPTRWRRKPAGIDMERNYVTVTLSIALIHNIVLLS